MQQNSLINNEKKIFFLYLLKFNKEYKFLFAYKKIEKN